MSDSCRIVWDALEARGFRPHGQPHDFRSVCPGHPGADNPEALHVWDVGGEAKMWCFTHGCDRLDVVEPVGLRLRDLYPAERQYRNTRLPRARREDFTGNYRDAANFLLALQQLERRCEFSVALEECPNCEWPHARVVWPSTGEPFVHCQRECGIEAIQGGLAHALTEQRRAR